MKKKNSFWKEYLSGLNWEMDSRLFVISVFFLSIFFVDYGAATTPYGDLNFWIGQVTVDLCAFGFLKSILDLIPFIKKSDWATSILSFFITSLLTPLYVFKIPSSTSPTMWLVLFVLSLILGIVIYTIISVVTWIKIKNGSFDKQITANVAEKAKPIQKLESNDRTEMKIMLALIGHNPKNFERLKVMLEDLTPEEAVLISNEIKDDSPKRLGRKRSPTLQKRRKNLHQKTE